MYNYECPEPVMTPDEELELFMYLMGTDEPEEATEETQMRVIKGKIIGAMRWMQHSDEEIKYVLEKFDILNDIMTEEQALRHMESFGL